MKLMFLLPAAALLAAVMLTGCAGSDSGEESVPAETTAAETVTTAPETTEETTTTTTTTTTLPYIVQEGVSLTYLTASARPVSCIMQMENSGEEPVNYQAGDFRIYDANGNELPLTAEEGWQPKIKTTAIPAGETAEIKYAWKEQYGELAEGSYILEQIFVEGKQSEEDSDEDTEERPTVLRAEFQIVGTDYAPVLTIDPATVSTTGCTCKIVNAPDQARDYTPSYKVFEANTDKMLIRENDREAKRTGQSHFEPSDVREFTYNWAKVYGRLPDGRYELQIEFTGCDDHVTSSYRVLFEVVT